MAESDRILTVVIADDSSVVRERLSALLREMPRVAVLAETRDVAETLSALHRLRPNLLILDMGFPDGSGLEVLRKISEQQLATVTFVLTNFAYPEYETAALALGARAFLNKSTEFMKVAELAEKLAASRLSSATEKSAGQDPGRCVGVSRQAGEGITPAVCSPVTAAAAERGAAFEPRFGRGTETILLAEDDAALRRGIRRLLEGVGYRVHDAACAGEALELWERHASEVALLVTDVLMPDGMTGGDLAERLRARRPELKVVFMSGDSADALGIGGQVEGPNTCFLSKPCSTESLVRAVRGVLDDQTENP